MNSYEIIKAELTKQSRPGTFGRTVDMNAVAELFVKLMPNLTDREAATESMNKDDDIRQAILNRGSIKEMREAGIIR